MKSVVLCEGPDDLWFIGYYLYKCKNWESKRSPDKRIWKNYEVAPINKKQQVLYLQNGIDSVAIWCVAGKDSFQHSVDVIFQKFNANFSMDPIESLVIFTDRDEDSIDDRLNVMQSWLPEHIELQNKESTSLCYSVDNSNIHMKITPVIIPFSEEGAIETLLMNAIQEESESGKAVVSEAKKYISTLKASPAVTAKYLNHDRLILKAKFSATIAATNPDHSTGLFQDLVMTCPWEKSEYVSTHLDVVLKAITSDNS